MKIFIIIITFIIQLITSEFIVREFVFLDATPTFLEKLIYHLATIPPFLVAVILIVETKNLKKSLIYTSIFYTISSIMIQLFLKVPNSVEYQTGASSSIGSYGFFQTGGGFGALSLIPQLFITLITVIILKKQQ